MRAILKGTDHTELGQTETTTVAPGLAIAITRGRHLKSYAYVDPNEDVVVAAVQPHRVVMVVADGHSGHEGAELAVSGLLTELDQTPLVWDAHAAVKAFHRVNESMRSRRDALHADRRRTRATLIAAVIVRGADGDLRLTSMSVGDSACFVVGAAAVRRVSKERNHFMGDRYSPPQMAGALHHEQVDLTPDDAVVLVSDGYTNFAHRDGLATAEDADPAAWAHAIIDTAGEAGAGDNVAVALATPAVLATIRPSADLMPADRTPR